MPTLKTGLVQAPVLGSQIGYTRTLAIALFNQKSYLYAVAANSTTTITLGRGEGSWTRTKKPIKAPDFTARFSCCQRFRTKTHFCSVPVRLPFRQSTHIQKLEKFADLRHTLCLTFTHIQPVRRHGLSTRERPQYFRPQWFQLSCRKRASALSHQISRRIGIPATFTRHSEIFDNNQLNHQAFMFIAIGLLVPQPRLIAGLLKGYRSIHGINANFLIGVPWSGTVTS